MKGSGLSDGICQRIFIYSTTIQRLGLTFVPTSPFSPTDLILFRSAAASSSLFPFHYVVELLDEGPCRNNVVDGLSQQHHRSSCQRKGFDMLIILTFALILHQASRIQFLLPTVFVPPTGRKSFGLSHILSQIIFGFVHPPTCLRTILS